MRLSRSRNMFFTVCMTSLLFGAVSEGNCQLGRMVNRQVEGIGMFRPSEGGTIIRPFPIEDYFGSLTTAQTRVLRQAIESSDITFKVIADFDKAAGVSGLFREIQSSKGGNPELAAALERSFAFVYKQNEIYLTSAGVARIREEYSGSGLSKLLSAMAKGNNTPVLDKAGSPTSLGWETAESGQEMLAESDVFIPVSGEYSIEGVFRSMKPNQILDRYHFTNKDVGEAKIGGWCYIKGYPDDKVSGWVIKLSGGMVVIPVTIALLKSITDDWQGTKPPIVSYPESGRVVTKIVGFNSDGAIADLSQGSGLYISYGIEDLDNPTVLSFADNPEFSRILADADVMEQAKALLKKLAR
jgi:hypothetical protein